MHLAPKNKRGALKSVMRRLRISETALAEEGFHEVLTRGGLAKRPHPWLDGVRNVQRVVVASNLGIGEVKRVAESKLSCG